MKKAKYMLCSLALVGLIATAFAFRMNRQTHALYTGEAGSGVCVNRVAGVAIFSDHARLVAASTEPLTINCPDVWIDVIDN